MFLHPDINLKLRPQILNLKPGTRIVSNSFTMEEWAADQTVVRTLESAARNGRVVTGPGSTALFIRPGFEFKIVDRLLTNFHLPKSTLLVLVSALAGRDLILEAYREAIREKFRFFSYGDCMLII